MAHSSHNLLILIVISGLLVFFGIIKTYSLIPPIADKYSNHPFISSKKFSDLSGFLRSRISIKYHQSVESQCASIPKASFRITPSFNQKKPKKRAIVIPLDFTAPYMEFEGNFESACGILYNAKHFFNNQNTNTEPEFEMVVLVSTELEHLKMQKILDLGGRIFQVDNQLTKFQANLFALEMFDLVLKLDTAMLMTGDPAQIFQWYDEQMIADSSSRFSFAAVQDVKIQDKVFNSGLYLLKPDCDIFGKVTNVDFVSQDGLPLNYDQIVAHLFKDSWIPMPARFCAQWLKDPQKIESDNIVFVHDALWQKWEEFRHIDIQKKWWDLHLNVEKFYEQKIFERQVKLDKIIQKMNLKNILLLSMDVGRDETLVYPLHTHETFAFKNGYDYRVSFKDTVANSRSKVWNKIHLLQQYLSPESNLDWIWWVDSDLIIMNYEIDLHDHVFKRAIAYRLERGIEDVESMDMIITHDCNGFNAGSFLLKNSPWSRKLLKDVMAIDMNIVPDNGYQEQAALAYFIKNEEYSKNRIEVVPQRLINSYGHGLCGYQYQNGDLCVHFPGFKQNMKKFIESSKTGIPWQQLVYPNNSYHLQSV